MPFNFGPFEIILILVVILIIFGVGRLPEVGGAIGKGIREFRRAQSETLESDISTQKEANKPSSPTAESKGPASSEAVEKTESR